jgi:hypothetical protein
MNNEVKEKLEKLENQLQKDLSFLVELLNEEQVLKLSEIIKKIVLDVANISFDEGQNVVKDMLKKVYKKYD